MDLSSIDVNGFEVAVQVCLNSVAATYVAESLNIEQLGHSVQLGEYMTLTRGNGLMSHNLDSYGPVKEGILGERHNGVLISQDDGDAVAYALWKLQDRGRMFVSPGDPLYEGMIIGIHSRDNDLVDIS